MSKILASNPAPLREAFLELSTAQQVPDAKLLDEVIRRYPQFSSELTEFAIALAVDALQVDADRQVVDESINTNFVSPAVSRAMSHFQNRLHALTSGPAPTSAGFAVGPSQAVNPFKALSRTQFRDLAERLNANIVFVTKLRDRDIEPSSISPGFRRRIAEELTVPLELVVAHFAGERFMPSGQFHKADDKPTIGARQTFEEAVRGSGLSEEQQRALLDL